MFCDTDTACMRTCRRDDDCKINTVKRSFECVEGCCANHGRRANLHTLTSLWLKGYLTGAATREKGCREAATGLLRDLLQLTLDEHGALERVEGMLNGCAK